MMPRTLGQPTPDQPSRSRPLAASAPPTRAPRSRRGWWRVPASAGAMALLLLAGTALTAQAQDDAPDDDAPADAPDLPPQPEPPAALTIDESGWQGGAQPLPNQPNRIGACGVAREYDNGLTLVMSMNLEGFTNLSLVNPEWSLTPQEQTTASIDIDGQIGGDGPIVNAGETVRILPLGPEPALVDALKRGNVLNISFEDESWQFPLRGTFNALTAVEECVAASEAFMEEIAAYEAAVAEATGATEDDGDGDGGGGGTAAPDGDAPAAVPQRTGIPIGQLNDFLAAAGVENVTFFPPERVPQTALDLLHVWQVDGVLNGAIHQRPREGDAIELQAFADDYLGRLIGQCPGEVAVDMDEMETFQDRFALMTGSVTCTTEEAASYLSVVFALDGLFYSVFYHESSLDDAARADEASGKIAALIRQLAGSAEVGRDVPPPEAPEAPTVSVPEEDTGAGAGAEGEGEGAGEAGSDAEDGEDGTGAGGDGSEEETAE